MRETDRQTVTEREREGQTDRQTDTETGIDRDRDSLRHTEYPQGVGGGCGGVWDGNTNKPTKKSDFEGRLRPFLGSTKAIGKETEAMK